MLCSYLKGPGEISMQLQWPHAVGTSPDRRISQSHIASLATITRGCETPPTSSTASGTTRRSFTGQIHASSHKTPNTNSGPPGNQTTIPHDGLRVWASTWSGGEKDLPWNKNGDTVSGIYPGLPECITITSAGPRVFLG